MIYSKCTTFDQLFLRKVIKLMPPDALISAQMHQNVFGGWPQSDIPHPVAGFN